jgi:hypothetical protein
MKNKTKLKFLALTLIVVINAPVIYGLCNDSTVMNLANVGGATVTDIKSVSVATPTKFAATPVTARVVVAVVALLVTVLGKGDNDQSYLSASQDYKNFQLAKLDK